jgi:hypothetical protein
MALVAIDEGLPLEDLPPFENARAAAEVEISGCEIVQALVVALAPPLQHRMTALITRLKAIRSHVRFALGVDTHVYARHVR